MTDVRRFAFLPDLVVEIVGPSTALRHFDAEYGTRAETDATTTPAVRIGFGSGQRTDAPAISGGHKTVRWRVAISQPAARPVAAAIELGGRPLSFGLSLVQGYFVEPLISAAAVDAGSVLLPAAAVSTKDGTVLIIGRSRSGKSSLCARALAGGQCVLGDDQVLLDSSGTCRAFPRRLRLYSDLERSAPVAYARLPAEYRRALAARKLVHRLSGGRIAPPIRVPFSAFDGVAPTPRVVKPLQRVVVVERTDGLGRLQVDDLDITALVDLSAAILHEQRRMLTSERADWRDAFAQLLERERRLLQGALIGPQMHRISVPNDWDAALAVESLAGELGIGRPD